MAVWCLVTWRHPGQSHGGGWCSWVKSSYDFCFSPISWYSHICFKCYYAHEGFLTLIEMLFQEPNEFAFMLLMSISLNRPQKNNSSAKSCFHFSYLNSIVSASFGTFVKHSYNAPVFVKCFFFFIHLHVIVVCSSPDGFTSLLWRWNIWMEHIKSSRATDKAEIRTWKSTASSHT